MNGATTTCTCWCENGIVVIPVEWVDEGRTAPCDLPSCEPGCPTRSTDAFEDEWDEPSNVHPIREKRIMTHDYDPRADSSPDVPEEVRRAYPGLILTFEDLTHCGCGCRATKSGKARFLPGHDAKLKGKLQRALAAEVPVHEIGGDGSVHTSTALDTARFYGWEAIVRKGAERIVARSQTPIAAEKRLYKIAEDGREGWTLIETSRWDVTGRLITFWRRDEDGYQQAMYVTPDGQIETFETVMAS